MIPITKPFMPPKKEYEQYLQGIWEREYLTNNGPLVRELENKLVDYLELRNLSFVSNGTIALQIAIKALDIKGEVITTPFSYVATTSSIVWEGCTPIFVDIDSETLNINPNLIEQVITDNTSAILATHTFGNPCDIEAIQTIADKYDLKVIYDASHCFGTEYKEQSVLNYGDVSTISFHATKLYHTVEGGGIVAKDNDLHEKVNRMRNFGHAGPGNFEGVGINGKNSEYHAAMGLCNLEYADQILNKRKKQSENYDTLLNEYQVHTPGVQAKTTYYNRAYYPIIFETEQELLDVKKKLEESKIFPRRYFYPSLNTLDYVVGRELEQSESIAKRILCLPLFHSLVEYQQCLVIDVIDEEKRMIA